MCDATAIAVATFAMAAGSTAYSVDQQNKQAAYQNELNAYNDKLSKEALADNLNTVAYNQNQNKDSATNDILQASLQSRQAEASARVAAGESGISGATVDSLLRDIKSKQSLYVSDTLAGLEQGNMDAAQQSKQQWNNYLSEVGNRTPSQKASMVAAGLQIGSAAVSSYSTYKQLSYQEKAANKKTT